MTRRRQATKPELVKKVEGELGIEAKDLDRLPIDTLNKLDDITPDIVVDEFKDVPQEVWDEVESKLTSPHGSTIILSPESESPSVSGEIEDQVEDDIEIYATTVITEGPILEVTKPKVLVGKHPTTGEKVYK